MYHPAGAIEKLARLDLVLASGTSLTRKVLTGSAVLDRLRPLALTDSNPP